MLERLRDKAGDRYEYFTCSGRRRRTTNCTRSAILAERAEAEIERTYQRNSLSRTQAEHVRKVLNDVFDQLEGSSEDERKLLTAQRDKLEAERLKLVQAHYADAIPLDLLKTEQDRIRASLDQITTRLDNLADTYAEARAGLDQLTDLLVDLDDLYNKCEPAERRILNRPLFTRITIDDEENATYPPRADHSQRPRPHQHRCPSRSHRRNKTAPPSGGARFDFLILRGARGIRTPDLLIANETRYQLRHSPKARTA